jgi:membrane protein DedA with SNARE-associated domain
MIPTSLPQLLELVRANGDAAYAFLFSYALANSLIMALLAGYAAHLGVLGWTKVFLVCWAGAFTGDAVRFWLARRYGARLLAKFPRVETAVMSIVRLVERHYGLVIFIHRYPHGIRGVAAFACGIGNVPAGPFLAINAVSAGVWAGAVTSLGYGFGHLSDKVLGDAASGLSIVTLILFLGVFWIFSRKLDQAIGSDVRK